MLNVTDKIQLNPQKIGGDKSFSHRALILAAVATTTSKIFNLSTCDDVLATVDCLNALGAKITLNGSTATVKPIVEPRDGCVLNCKNSGTTARLLAGLVCGLNVNATFVGDKSLAARPMKRVLEPLAELGASFCENGSLSGFLFSAKRHGGLKGKTIYAKVNSAQVKSAVLLAATFAEGQTTYVEAVPTRRHTEKMLSELGVCQGCAVFGGKKYQGFEVCLPSDISSAAYLIALAVAKNEPLTVDDVCLSDERIGFLRALKSAGANVEWNATKTVFGEPIGSVTVLRGGKLGTFHVSAQDVADGIDEIPLLAALSLTAKGMSKFCGVSELKVKESDRLAAIEQMAKSCGQSAKVENGDLVVDSDGKLPTYVAFDAVSYDHRIQMCQVVLGVIAGGGRIPSVDSVAVSFPTFWEAIGAQFKRFAVLGADVSKSLSPALMCFFAKELGIWLEYTAASLGDNATDDELLSQISRFNGVNVTMPYKACVAKLLNAGETVNTVWNGKACSTDGFGIVAALDAHKIDFRNKELLIIGAGGAAEQAIITLKQCGAALSVVNRTQSRADALKSKYELLPAPVCPQGILSFVPACEWEQTLSVPQSVKFVFVAAYGGESHLATIAKNRNLSCVYGEEMLYYQGAMSLSLWLGDDAVMRIDDGYEKFIREVTI